MELGPVRNTAAAMDNSPAGPLYSQQSVILGQDDIRVLILLPGKPGWCADPIICKLERRVLPGRTASACRPIITKGVLSKRSLPKPTYTALSYQWGSTAQPKLIHCNGIPVYVTRSLYSALLHLRNERRPIVLWVDALCINQRDNSERGQQVQRMGNGTFSSHRAFKSCRSLAASARTTLTQPPPGNERQNPSPPSVWIIQEIALSTNIDLVCGYDKISFTEFNLGVVPSLASRLGGKNVVHLSHIMAVRSLLATSAREGVQDLAYVYGELARHQLRVDKNILTLLNLSRRSEATVAADKVYSLLGLGEEIEPGSTYGIQAVYSGDDQATNTELAYINAARRILQAQNSLRLFGSINPREPPPRSTSTSFVKCMGACIGFSRRAQTSTAILPTWVPDWSDRSDTGTAILPHERFSATGGVAYNFVALNPNAATDLRLIRLSGHLLVHCGVPVTISALSSVCKTERAQNTLLFRLKMALTLSRSYRLDTIRDWWRMFDDGTQRVRNEFFSTITCGDTDTSYGVNLEASRAAIFDSPQRRGFLGLQPLLQALYAYLGARTAYLALWPGTEQLYWVCLNCIALPFTIFFATSVVYRVWPNLDMGGGGSTVAHSLHAIESRRLARLSSGHLALVPQASLLGDAIALCRGGNVPLLLRQHEMGEHFEMVGECYVDAVMDGSFFREDDCQVITLV
ncbi:heterokaryon incompatibility protein-domain-containing protein [Chaetomium sp. MPI-CAGE-AT-0009]|nr:heterokaryon incompatibility protein-domain-containing protein [Chaetomium sp. MPI-CAGE-AT-0009]